MIKMQTSLFYNYESTSCSLNINIFILFSQGLTGSHSDPPPFVSSIIFNCGDGFARVENCFDASRHLLPRFVMQRRHFLLVVAVLVDQKERRAISELATVCLSRVLGIRQCSNHVIAANIAGAPHATLETAHTAANGSWHFCSPGCRHKTGAGVQKGHTVSCISVLSRKSVDINVRIKAGEIRCIFNRIASFAQFRI